MINFSVKCWAWQVPYITKDIELAILQEEKNELFDRAIENEIDELLLERQTDLEELENDNLLDK